MIKHIQVYELRVPPKATKLSQYIKVSKGASCYIPASFSIRRLVQYFIIIARGRTRSSISTYVLIIRVFSRARVLFTFISQANRSSGSHILTIGTLAWDTQTTRSMPSVARSAQEGLRIWISTYVLRGTPLGCIPAQVL